MTIFEALHFHGGHPTDKETLLSAVLGQSRTWLMAHESDEVPAAVADLWPHFLARLISGEPTAYILGSEEFLGRSFLVDPRVLIPRACTERLVAAAESVLDGETTGDETVEIDLQVVAMVRRLRPGKPRTVVEIGTGSGCIAISLALSHPSVRVIATDISQDVLDLAALNVERFGLSERVQLRRGDCLNPVLEILEPFLLVSNPPYVPDDYVFQRSVHAYEPMLALRGGGRSGGALLEMIVQQAAAHPACAGMVVECRADQVPSADAVLRSVKKSVRRR